MRTCKRRRGLVSFFRCWVRAPLCPHEIGAGGRLAGSSAGRGGRCTAPSSAPTCTAAAAFRRDSWHHRDWKGFLTPPSPWQRSPGPRRLPLCSRFFPADPSPQSGAHGTAAKQPRFALCTVLLSELLVLKIAVFQDLQETNEMIEILLRKGSLVAP